MALELESETYLHLQLYFQLVGICFCKTHAALDTLADVFYFQYVLRHEFIEINEHRNAVLSSLFLLSFAVYMQVVILVPSKN